MPRRDEPGDGRARDPELHHRRVIAYRVGGRQGRVGMKAAPQETRGLLARVVSRVEEDVLFVVG